MQKRTFQIFKNVIVALTDKLKVKRKTTKRYQKEFLKNSKIWGATHDFENLITFSF